MAKYSIELPTLAGTRWSAQELISKLPEDLSSSSVELDCSLARSTSQGFADELIREILELRGARSLRFLATPLPLAAEALESAELRGLQGLELQL